jgi:hypothetical protein
MWVQIVVALAGAIFPGTSEGTGVDNIHFPHQLL